jgi:hypothetical protein
MKLTIQDEKEKEKESEVRLRLSQSGGCAIVLQATDEKGTTKTLLMFDKFGIVSALGGANIGEFKFDTKGRLIIT